MENVRISEMDLRIIVNFIAFLMGGFFTLIIVLLNKYLVDKLDQENEKAMIEDRIRIISNMDQNSIK